MKLNLFFFFLYILSQLTFSQCNKETISYSNGNYIGCVNYEGQKDGKGVGSKFETKVIKIDEILIGNYKVKNVIATVPLNEEINSSLIGIGFLKKFKEVLWSLNSNLMRFYK